MSKSLKLKWFFISSLCLIVVLGAIFIVCNRLNNSRAVVFTDINKEVAVTNEINKKQIYGSFMTEANWVADPSDPKNLLQYTEDSAIIKVKIKSIGDAIFIKKTISFNNPQPFTPIEVTVEKLLDGQISNNINTIYLRGGDAKISDLMETLDQETIKKLGFDTLTKEQQKTMYVSYKSEYDYNLKPGEEYIFVVAKNSNNIYTIIANGYGIFKEDQEMISEGIIKNVLTKKELTDRYGKVLKYKK